MTTVALRTVTVVDAGLQTTVQELPGRTGYWAVGVPPSGAWDDLSFALANLAVGNPETAAGLEFVRGLQLVQARGDGAPRDPRGAGDPGDAAPTYGGRFGCGRKPPSPFIEERGEHLESGFDIGIGDHALHHRAEFGFCYTYFVARPYRSEPAD